MTSPTVPMEPVRARPLERLLAMRVALSWEIALYAAVFAAAIALRWLDLGARALHHDESIHAQWSWNLLRGEYRHDPVFHGPFYYHVQGLVFFLFGANDYTARVSAAIFGTALVALPLLLRKRLGAVGTFATVALIAFSPTLVYYSRFFREDIYMAVFTLIMAAAMWRYIDGGRDRWLVVFALAFTGSVATKEATYLTAAVFLVFTDVLLANILARQSLDASGTNTMWRRAALTAGLAPFAWLVASLWPFLPALRRRFDWADTLPRGGDVLIILGTLTLPLLTPFLEAPLERLNYVDKGQLVCGPSLSRSHGIAIGGLFAITLSGAAFVGLQWRPRTWLIAAGLSALVYTTLYTSLWTNAGGLCTGPWGSLDYWRSQQDVHRGDQPWFYYNLLLPAYEFLPLIIAVGGIWWSLVRGTAFSRFLWVWLIGFYIGLSWGSEKMPWLNTHLALPACLLAAWTVNRAWQAWTPRPSLRAVAPLLVSVAATGMGALILIAYLPTDPMSQLFRLVLFAGAILVIVYAARPHGRKAAATFAVVAAVGALSFFSLHTMVDASFTRGDVPKDMLIYTQSSPDIPDIMADISALAEQSGLGYQLPIAVDSTDSFAWPWAWYLRDYKAVAYIDFTDGPPTDRDYQVLLVNQSNLAKTNDKLASSTGTLFGPPRKYPHRWWFDETYKEAMSTGSGPCVASGGDCGPWHFETWKTIADGIFNKNWPATWFYYWRDHDPDKLRSAQGDRRCNSCGSVDAYAFFPANFDTATQKFNLAALEPPKPSTDKSGRPTFGGLGRQPGQFFAPVDIARDSDGNLYVIDSQSKKLQKFDRDGNFFAAVDVRPDPKDATEQSQPWGLAIAPNGDVVVADTFGWRIRVFDRDLKPTGVTFGTAPPKPGDPIGPYTLYGPRDIIFDRDGNMWVTDTGHARIVVYTPAGEFVRQIGGTKGRAPGQFDEPVSLAIAGDGTVAVADMFNARVVLLDPAGKQVGEFPVQGWGGQDVTDKPYMTFLRDGRLAVSLPSLGQVQIFSRSGQLQGTVSPADEPLSRPYGIAETADGKLWIVEGGASRVRQFPIP